MRNYLTYPTKIMNISQGYNGTYSHLVCSSGIPCEYPIDEPCTDSGRDYMYCPCDEMEIVRIYGVKTSGTNTIWLTSTSKVDTPCGTDTITMMVMHPEDDDLSKLKVGQKFQRGQAMFREGNDGFSNGNHFHISFGKGKILGNGWALNNKNAWVLTTTNGTIKPEQACYINKNFTQVKRTQDIVFKEVPKISEIKGIDVSKFNTITDWTKVKSDGIDFVMVRAGFGSNENQIDTKFSEHVDGALKAGLNVGCYWFSYALSINDVKKEAALFNKTMSPYRGKLTYPVCFDFEYDSVVYAKNNGVSITKEIATEFALTFCKEMEVYGWYSMNYTNLDFAKNYFDSVKLKQIDTWYAHYNESEPSVYCGIWQYSSGENVSGIFAPVDANISYKDYSSIIKNAGLNGWSINGGSNSSGDLIESTIRLTKKQWADLFDKMVANKLL